MGVTESMGDERLARLNADNEPRGDHLSGLTADEVGELLDEVKRLHGALTTETATCRRWLRRVVEQGKRANNAEAACEDFRAQLTEIGETEVEWGYWFDDEFNVSERQFSVGDVRYHQEQSGRPVERRLVGEWREVPDA